MFISFYYMFVYSSYLNFNHIEGINEHQILNIN
jgi:hypothetical protein